MMGLDTSWITFQSSTEPLYAFIKLNLIKSPGSGMSASKCSIFLTGLQHLMIITDHNSLIAINIQHSLPG